MVIDSPFSDLEMLTDELTAVHSTAPGFVKSTAKKMVRKSVKKRANFDITQLKPIDHVRHCTIPALFIYGENDNFIDPHHCRDVFYIYPGEKNIIAVPACDHNTDRDEFTDEQIVLFFEGVLECALLPTEVARV
jgi:pimeloyl-ACP methyl ester carboxylesterase